MKDMIYNHFVRSNLNIKYEYERYVQEHLDEHYTNRFKQWKILFELNWHYKVKKKKFPLIYWDKYLPENNLIRNDGSIFQQTGIVNDIYNAVILPGYELCKKILYGYSDDTLIFLCPYAGTGDVYLASMYMKEFAKENRIKDFIVVVIGNSNYKTASLFKFERIIKIEQNEADNLVRLCIFLGAENKKIIIMHHQAPQVYCGIMENLRNINYLTFSDLYLNNVFHLDLYKGRENPQFNYASDKIKIIFKDNGLEEGNTIILSPYVNTLPPLPWWVWVNLANKLKELGYIVCTNCGYKSEKEIEGTIALHFGLDISVPLLERCGYFIGIRSGFCDIISSAKCKKIIIYHPYTFWGSGTAFDYFSLNKNGLCNDAIEMEYQGVEFLDLIDQILIAVQSNNPTVNQCICTEKKSVDYIIVQAGGKGSRLGYLTKNKPKALVSVDNVPILFHLFRKFPDKKFIVIGDYKYDVLKRYLKAFAEVEYVLVNAKGKEGTCGGIQEALKNIPPKSPFMLIWSDLVLAENFSLENIGEKNYIGISTDFSCRWKYENGVFSEECSAENGVAGMFIFQEKRLLHKIPESGEFVQWLSRNSNIKFSVKSLSATNEYGVLDEYKKVEVKKCRPFNKLEVLENVLVKEGINEQGKQLAKREMNWYKKVTDSQFRNLPQIYAYEPLIMENILGKNIYEYTSLEFEEKQNILKQIIKCLKELHAIGDCKFEKESYEDAYIEKTLFRLEKVKELIPFAKEPYIVVNGRKCRNFLYHLNEVRSMLKQYAPKRFVFLHGDCTFSNIMMKKSGEIVFIDPRGYFGKTEFFGDAAYDWAKLYYSIVGNYDQFNLKKFKLDIQKNGVFLDIASSGWEDMEETFFELIGEDVLKTQIKLIHAIIWLSLTTYAWDDYDSICGAFYNGLFYFEEIF